MLVGVKLLVASCLATGCTQAPEETKLHARALTTHAASWPHNALARNITLCLAESHRAIVTAEKALLFEPNSAATRKFLEVVLPRIRNNTPASAARAGESPSAFVNASHADYMARYYKKDESHAHMPPFELEVLEAALTVATGEWGGGRGMLTSRHS